MIYTSRAALAGPRSSMTDLTPTPLPARTVDGTPPLGLPTRLVRFAVLLSGLLATLLVSWVATSREIERADLRLASAELVSGSPERAGLEFEALAEGSWTVGDARQGWGLAQWIASGEWPLEEPPDPLRVPGLDLPQLARRAVMEGRSRELLELVEKLPPESRAGAAPALELALLELGWENPPSGLLASSLADTVDRSTVIRDRYGRHLGERGPTGELRWQPEVEELGWDDWLPEVLPRTVTTPGLRLTLDLELSQRVRDTLTGERGTIVVVDPRSGEVLVAVSDPRTVAREGGAAFLEQRREPASIAKLITASAAQRAGLDLDDVIGSMRCNGSVEVEDGRLYCPVVAGRLDGFDQALASSCNTTFAELGLELGSERMLAELERFGFTSPERAVDFHGRWRERIVTRRQLSELAVGLERSDITPLHAAEMAAVFAEGRRVEARFLRAADGRLGLSPRLLGFVPGEPVVEPDHLAVLQRAMRAVTTWGTAARVGPEGLDVGMKTGTASEPGKGFHVNYIGVVPMSAPRYAFSVRVTDRPTSRRVRRAAYGVTSRLLDVLSHRLDPPAVERWQTRLAARDLEPERPTGAAVRSGAGG